jgi:hypothetical protein
MTGHVFLLLTARSMRSHEGEMSYYTEVQPVALDLCDSADRDLLKHVETNLRQPKLAVTKAAKTYFDMGRSELLL